MGFKLVRLDGLEPAKISLKIGSHTIGRGSFLGCHDHRVSRQHASLEVKEDTVILKSLHQNPCFYNRGAVTKTTILPEGEWVSLSNGDHFGLLPKQNWFELLLCDEDTPMDSAIPNQENVVTEKAVDESRGTNNTGISDGANTQAYTSTAGAVNEEDLSNLKMEFDETMGEEDGNESQSLIFGDPATGDPNTPVPIDDSNATPPPIEDTPTDPDKTHGDSQITPGKRPHTPDPSDNVKKVKTEPESPKTAVDSTNEPQDFNKSIDKDQQSPMDVNPDSANDTEQTSETGVKKEPQSPDNANDVKREPESPKDDKKDPDLAKPGSSHDHTASCNTSDNASPKPPNKPARERCIYGANCYRLIMASNKSLSTAESSNSSKRSRINVTSQHFQDFVMENLNLSDSDETSASENEFLPPEPDINSSSDEEVDPIEDDPIEGALIQPDLEETVHEDTLAARETEQNQRHYYYGKRRCMKWATEPLSRNRRTPAHNIVIPMANVNIPAESDPVSLFTLFLTQTMKDQIILHTNERMELLRQKYKRVNKPELKNLDKIEFDAFLGLLVYSAVFKSNDEDVNALFATDGTGRDIFRAVMSKARFQVILVALRFDDFFTREERKTSDVAAAVSEIFEEFISNCQKYYRLGDNTTIDEMLVSFRGRCRWKKYMPNKPCKYGLEIKCLTDGRTGYLYNAYLYVGKNSDGLGLSDAEKKLLLPTQCVLRLSKPIQNTNRNITADNYFSSIEVCDELRKVGLTYVGTVKKNKSEIPTEFLEKNRPVQSTKYGFTKDTTLLSYVPKRNKTVIMVSTMHHEEVTDTQKNIPEIISFYNSSKGGVDSLDEKCAKYTCSRRSRRWPLVIFYRIVDISVVNAFILSNFRPDDRMIFMKNIAKSLVWPHLERRITITQLPLDLKGLLTRILGKTATPRAEIEPTDDRLSTRKNCYLCFKQKHRKTSYMCHACKKPVCLQCSKPACNTCR